MDNLAPVVETLDVPRKQDVDGKVAKAGDTMSGRLTVQGMSIGDHTQWGGWDAIENGASALIFASPPAADVVLQALGVSGSIYLRPNGGDTNAQVVLGPSSAAFAKPVVLPADPAQPLEAATKQYVDGKAANEVTVAAAQPVDGSELWLDLDATPALDVAAELAALRARVEELERRVG